MAKVKSAKAQKKIDDIRIEKMYGQRCSGIQIDIMDIGRVFKVGQQAINEGVDDTVLGDRILEYVNTIRHN